MDAPVDGKPGRAQLIELVDERLFDGGLGEMGGVGFRLRVRPLSRAEGLVVRIGMSMMVRVMMMMMMRVKAGANGGRVK